MRRWLASGGQIGRPPDWYPLLRAARYLGVAPWELAQQPAAWMQWALTAESSESQAQEAARPKPIGRRK